MDVKRTPLCVEMFEDLDGGCVMVDGVGVLELRVPVFDQGLSEICCDSLEETFSDCPCFASMLPFLLHVLPGICCCCVVNIVVICSGFDFLYPC